ncbi:MAG TPA: hypothetical protein EYH27_00195 [Anaerolineales bacterium]|nr:hypothetical protein [Anaerolineales bacterium]
MNRRKFLFSGGLALLIGFLLAGCVLSLSSLLFEWTGEEATLGQVRGVLQLVGGAVHPRPRIARYEPVAHAGVNPFGINVFLEQEVEPWKREQTLRMVAEAGFHWIRQSFPWEDIEIHGKGDFEDRRHEPYRSAWEKYDHIVSLAEQYDLEVIARLSNPPAWSRADGNARGTYAPPDRLEDFGDYVYTVVSRYRGRIRYYQIWNEPNIYPEWGEQPVDPEGYTELLCLAYRRAKEADPDAVIISGALAQTIALDPGPGPGAGLNDLVFLQRMYDAGAADCFDILAVNDYLLWSGPTDRRLHPLTINYGRFLYLRDIMVVNGDGHKPIWISEMNANAVPNDPSIRDWGRYGQVTLEQQARYAPMAYQRALEEWPWVGVINFWFFKRASDAERDQSWYYFRMVEPDFTPLPVYDAMRDYITSLTPTLYPGVHQEDHWALEYEGEWEDVAEETAVLGAYRRARTGARVSFVFKGNRLALTPGPEVGKVVVLIDANVPQTLTLEGEPVTLFSATREDLHHVEIAVVEGWGSLDAITVYGR